MWSLNSRSSMVAEQIQPLTIRPRAFPKERLELHSIHPGDVGNSAWPQSFPEGNPIGRTFRGLARDSLAKNRVRAAKAAKETGMKFCGIQAATEDRQRLCPISVHDWRYTARRRG